MDITFKDISEGIAERLKGVAEALKAKEIEQEVFDITQEKIATAQANLKTWKDGQGELYKTAETAEA
jgi:hypothetical protein